ncbi:hypothetical protein Val02_63540 [Virgisporangium aliadipatigenens]|uniref:Uncharacterized protein n=1 Tax=Virgisporangium aliadipatigenens TaxID=741659 RepID=A0A8J4DTX0_9ACTN|nr:hypothetical protein [Virgisporangium aliadipatigenens]GIJ49468.1 hypothetical protein Val02_63540 [Virgisporangium aliadipatigenens]
MFLDPDPLRAYAEALAELAPGQRVLAAVVTHAAPGVGPLPPPERDLTRTPGTVAAGVAGAILSPNLPGGERLVRLLLGRAAGGAPDSLAARCRQACEGTSDLLLVVTDARLLLFEPLDGGHFVDRADQHDKPASARLRPLWETPVSTVRSARVGRYRLNWSRLTVGFGDGSWVAFASLLYMGRGKARRIAAALCG